MTFNRGCSVDLALCVKTGTNIVSADLSTACSNAPGEWCWWQHQRHLLEAQTCRLTVCLHGGRAREESAQDEAGAWDPFSLEDLLSAGLEAHLDAVAAISVTAQREWCARKASSCLLSRQRRIT